MGTRSRQFNPEIVKESDQFDTTKNDKAGLYIQQKLGDGRKMVLKGE